jgi:Tol biopolymer transport system component
MAEVTRDGRSLAETWSPDGSKIMFDGILGDSCLNELFVMNADGTGRVRITNGPASNFNGDWISGP